MKWNWQEIICSLLHRAILNHLKIKYNWTGKAKIILVEIRLQMYFVFIPIFLKKQNEAQCEGQVL